MQLQNFTCLVEQVELYLNDSEGTKGRMNLNWFFKPDGLLCLQLHDLKRFMFSFVYFFCGKWSWVILLFAEWYKRWCWWSVRTVTLWKWPIENSTNAKVCLCLAVIQFQLDIVRLVVTIKRWIIYFDNQSRLGQSTHTRKLTSLSICPTIK